MILSGEREHDPIAEALADRDRLGAGGDRGLEVAGRLVLRHGRQQQVAALDAVASLTFDQPPGTAEPPGCAAHLPLEGEVDADPERATRRSQALAPIQVQLVGTLQAAHVLVVAAEHVGRRGQQLEILGFQRRRPIRARQQLVGVDPRPPRIGLTAAFEFVDSRPSRHAQHDRGRQQLRLRIS
ncbi:MAG: hypothetical protein ACRDLY_20360 [Thermoleophilaceae bacterium]